MSPLRLAGAVVRMVGALVMVAEAAVEVVDIRSLAHRAVIARAEGPKQSPRCRADSAVIASTRSVRTRDDYVACLAFSK